MNNKVCICCCLIIGFSICVYGISGCCAEKEKTKGIAVQAIKEATIEGMKHGINNINLEVR